jgi:hypothetical protein
VEVAAHRRHHGAVRAIHRLRGRARAVQVPQARAKAARGDLQHGREAPAGEPALLDEILFLLRGEESREQLMVSSLMLHSMCESLFTVLPQLIFCACDLMILLLVVDMDCDSSSFWICFFVYYMYQIKPVLCTVTPTSFIFSFLP